MWYLVAKENKNELVVGTSRQILCNDLKTLRGVCNRYNAWINSHKKAGKIVEIYTTTNVYDENSYKLQKTY